MGHRCCSKQKVKKGLWSPEEDERLLKHITTHGHGSWSSVPKLAGLQRCGKSCRLRWINYLRPDLRRGSFSEEEEQIIIDVHRILGNRWAQIAKHLPGRTDNEVKNYWNSCIKKKLLSQGLDPKTHNLIPSHQRAAKKAACNLSQNFNIDHQPISVFNVNNANMTISNVSADIIRPPILTLPSPHHHHPPLPTSTSANQSPLLHQILVTTTAPTSEYQSTNVWDIATPATCNQNSHDSTIFPYVSSIESWPISSSPSTSVNPSRFGSLVDDNYCIWGGANTDVAEVEAFRAPGPEGTQAQEQHVQQLEKDDNINISSDQMNEAKGVDHQEIDCSFDSSSFDLEFVDSTLMSGAMCRDLGSISIDEFAWNF